MRRDLTGKIYSLSFFKNYTFAILLIHKKLKMKKNLLIISTLFLSVAANAQWTSQATGFTAPSRGIRNVCAIDANTVWVSAYDGITSTNPVRDFSKTTDGGTYWVPGTVTAPTSYAFSNIWAIDATTAWACFYDAAAGAGGGIFKTTDGGATWSQQGTGTIFNANSFPDFVYFWDANTGFAVGDPNGPGTSYYEIYTTTDGGTTWVRTPSANIPAKLSATEYAIVNMYSVQGNTIWFGTNQGRMYKSIDKGLNWTVSVVSSTTTDAIADVAFRSALNGIATIIDPSQNFSYFTTADGGTTWTSLTATTGTIHTSDIEAIPNTTTYVSTGSAPTDLGSSYSIDDGVTWVDIDVLEQRTAQAWVDGSTGWAGGFSTNSTTDGIFKYSGSVLGITAQNNDNARMRLYPNPSTGQFTLQIGGAETKDAVVKIVDVVGNVTFQENIKNNTTVIENKVDLTSVSKGIYFITVENGTTRFVNKIVIE